MQKSILAVLPLVLLLATPCRSAELLTADEQSFETGVTPGRWQKFIWPAGGIRPSPIGAALQGVGGGYARVTQAAQGAPGYGVSSAEVSDTSGGFDAFPDVAGLMITLPVQAGTMYTISTNITFFFDVAAYNSAGGISVDLDGGTDPLGIDYGYNVSGGGGPNDEFDPNRGGSEPAFASGDWLWNETFAGDHDSTWYGPSQVQTQIVATGSTMTIFLWGFDKYYANVIRFDGASVQGQVPLPPGVTDVVGWRTYR